MKTTSILTISGAVAIALLTIARISGDSHSPENHKAVHDAMNAEPLVLQDIIYDSFSEGAAQLAEDTAEIQNDITTRVTIGKSAVTVNSDGLCLEDLLFIEPEEEIVLGFDVNTYLPADFNPYGSYSDKLDLASIEFIEEDTTEVLGFDTAAYLPIGFDAYAGMEPDLDKIVYLEEEEPVVLGFDTRDYLPENFNAYARPDLNIEEIAFMENEEPVDLGFDVNAYLPADFDPYAQPEFDLDQIIFIEEDERIDLWQNDIMPSTEQALSF